MKVLYIARLSQLNSAIGVLKKIKAQKENLINEGVAIEVKIFYREGDTSLVNNFSGEGFDFIKFLYSGYKKPFHLLELWFKINSFIGNTKFDLVYFRYPGSSLFSFITLLWNKNRIIFEHNTKELDELQLKSKKPRIDILKEKVFARLSFKYCLGNVGMASEFTDHQEEKVNYPLNKFTVTNGVSVKEISKKNNQNSVDISLPKLIFVGNTANWHGLERIMEGLENYKGNRSYQIFLVGKEEKFLSLINRYNLQGKLGKELILTGYLTGNGLDELFNEAHFAIGSLGLHRINIKKGVPLKHREYLSRGIPFIFAGEDEDINEDILPFLMQIGGDESPINLDAIFNFIDSIYASHNNQLTTILRDFAFKKIDMAIKMKELHLFFQRSLINN